MAAVARGDEMAFRQLVRQHAPRTYAVARRYLASHDDADEATQEVFWRLWRSAAGWRPDTARVATWLYRITVNVCIDHTRSGRRRHTVETPGPELPDLPDSAANPEDAYAARQQLAAILDGISALPDEQRMSLILSVQQSLPNRDIAAAMGTSEGAVEQLLVRARRKLREIHRSVT